MKDPWIQTRTGVAYNLLNPDPATVVLEDLAFALSNISRYNGHTQFYSVATHSVRVADLLLAAGHSPEVQLHGLMHDSHEAYIGDFTSPLKAALFAPETSPADERFKAFERKHQQAICDAFGLDYHSLSAPPIKHADLEALRIEKSALHVDAGIWGCFPEGLLGFARHNWYRVSGFARTEPPERAEEAFLRRFGVLMQATGRWRREDREWPPPGRGA